MTRANEYGNVLADTCTNEYGTVLVDTCTNEYHNVLADTCTNEYRNVLADTCTNEYRNVLADTCECVGGQYKCLEGPCIPGVGMVYYFYFKSLQISVIIYLILKTNIALGWGGLGCVMVVRGLTD